MALPIDFGDPDPQPPPRIRTQQEMGQVRMLSASSACYTPFVERACVDLRQLRCQILATQSNLWPAVYAQGALCLL